MAFSFTFASKNSMTDYGIRVTTRPIVPSPKRKIEYIDIPGRSSRLTIDENAFEDITIMIPCWVQSTKDLMADKLDEIRGWLLNAGESDLVFSSQAGKKYRARVVNSINFETTYRVIGEFPIVFDCRPFKYDAENAVIEVTLSGTTVINAGTFASEPILKIYGTGDITVTIGAQSFMVKNVDTYVTVDSVLMDSYKDTTLKNSDMVGNFPILSVGANVVSWTGACSKIEITPNNRWL